MDQELTLAADDVLIRLENAQGGFVAYAINGQAFSERARESFEVIREGLPKVLRPIVDGALFALRHGPLQKMGREAGIDVAPFLKAGDKDAAAVAVAALLTIRNARKLQSESGAIEPIDVTHGDLVTAYQGVFRRVPEFDQLAAGHDGTGEPTAIEAPTGALG